MLRGRGSSTRQHFKSRKSLDDITASDPGMSSDVFRWRVAQVFALEASGLGGMGCPIFSRSEKVGSSDLELLKSHETSVTRDFQFPSVRRTRQPHLLQPHSCSENRNFLAHHFTFRNSGVEFFFSHLFAQPRREKMGHPRSRVMQRGEKVGHPPEEKPRKPAGPICLKRRDGTCVN